MSGNLGTFAQRHPGCQKAIGNLPNCVSDVGRLLEMCAAASWMLGRLWEFARICPSAAWMSEILWKLLNCVLDVGKPLEMFCNCVLDVGTPLEFSQLRLECQEALPLEPVSQAPTVSGSGECINLSSGWRSCLARRSILHDCLRRCRLHHHRTTTSHSAIHLSHTRQQHGLINMQWSHQHKHHHSHHHLRTHHQRT